MASSQSWLNDAIKDILSGNSVFWKEIAGTSKEIIEAVEPLAKAVDEQKIKLPEGKDIKVVYEDACRLKSHLESGGKLGWGLFRPKIVKERSYLIKDVQLNGRIPSTMNDFKLLCDILSVRTKIEKAWEMWAGKVDRVLGPYALQIVAIKSMCESLEEVLALEEFVKEYREVSNKCPSLVEPVWNDEVHINRLIASFKLAQLLHRKQLIAEEIRSVEYAVLDVAGKPNAHPIVQEILRAVRDKDIDLYVKSFNKVQDLKNDKQRLFAMEDFLSNLGSLLPELAKKLKSTCSDLSWDERLRYFEDAWLWAQARYWLEEYIQKEDMDALTKRANQVENEINATIAHLASLHAWSFCFSRLKEEHRRHMEAWRQAMRRLGKGTGKRAHIHRRYAQQHLSQCREAVPAWVMPLHRIWDTIDPFPEMFDVIIVDEASQCGLEALPLFYMGKKILIVGDDKQISPEAVGISVEAVHSLMEQLLYDFRFKSSFSVDSSLFDHGKLRYGTGRITLREHFRCMPEIIRFSNDLCYSDTPLVPLRQYGPDRLPPLQHVFVGGGFREGTGNRVINRPEAEAVVKKIVELCSDKRYKGKTMGVVILQGEAQARLIEELLLKELGAEEMEKRRLICGNPYSFQGDERDIIFLSMVAAPNERIGPLTKPADERRFNVAASRARDQMWLFHSVQINDLSDKDLRRRLLEFFLNTEPQRIAGIDREELELRAKVDNRSIVKPPAPFESWFEVDVALELLRRGFVVIPQFEVAGKRIDLVVEGGNARLAVECDGDYWHGKDRYDDDMLRQRQLERCGWEFFRVRESAFYANKKAVLEKLRVALEERNILPYYSSRKNN